MKKLIPFIFLILLASGISAEPPIPAPVKILVTVNGAGINYDATVENTRTGEVLTVKEVSSLAIRNGVGMFDLSDFKEGYKPYDSFYGYAGDLIEVKACDVHPDCTYKFNIVSRDPSENIIEINIQDESICVPTECPTCDCPECPDNTVVTVLITAILALIVSIGGGIKIYKNRLGEGVFLHRHKGIRGYHNPNTLHKNPIYRHRRWKDDPIGCMNDVMKINQGIAL
jgi:hypothetical protein